MSRFTTTAALSLSLFATNAFGADQSAQAPAQPQLADPRCTTETLQQMMNAQEKATGRPVTRVYIATQDNGAAPITVFQSDYAGSASVAPPDGTVLCEYPAQERKQNPGPRLNVSF